MSQGMAILVNDVSMYGKMQECRFIKKFSPENICLKAHSTSFPRAQGVLFLISTLNSFQDVSKVSGNSG